MTDLPTDWTELPSSSNIHSIGKAGNDLFVKFKSGGTYRYADAGAHHNLMMAASSAGSYLHQSGIKTKGEKVA